MPTLDDAPIIEELVASGSSGGSSPDPLTPAQDSDAVTELSKKDLIQVYDVSEQKVKTITVEDLAYSIASGAFA
jgi:hypothetical protein